MQTITCALLLLVGALAYADIYTPQPPVLPNSFIAIGDFLSLNKDGSIKGYGKFNMKYDWSKKGIRTDAIIFPESSYNFSYIAVWNNAENNILAFLPKDEPTINCEVSSSDDKVLSPNIFTKACEFKCRDEMGGKLVNVWDCQFGPVSIAAWSDAFLGTLTKLKVGYPEADVTMEFTAFVEVDSIDDDLLTPPKSWNCSSSSY